MGMDVYGHNGNYFRANIWQWRPICYAMHLAGYEVPEDWHYNNGKGLENDDDCQELATLLEAFLASWDDDILEAASKSFSVDENGKRVPEGTPNSRSPYAVSREHLQEFIEFLKSSGGFCIW